MIPADLFRGCCDLGQAFEGGSRLLLSAQTDVRPDQVDVRRCRAVVQRDRLLQHLHRALQRLTEQRATVEQLLAVQKGREIVERIALPSLLVKPESRLARRRELGRHEQAIHRPEVAAVVPMQTLEVFLVGTALTQPAVGVGQVPPGEHEARVTRDGGAVVADGREPGAASVGTLPPQVVLERVEVFGDSRDVGQVFAQHDLQERPGERLAELLRTHLEEAQPRDPGDWLTQSVVHHELDIDAVTLSEQRGARCVARPESRRRPTLRPFGRAFHDRVPPLERDQRRHHADLGGALQPARHERSQVNALDPAPPGADDLNGEDRHVSHASHRRWWTVPRQPLADQQASGHQNHRRRRGRGDRDPRPASRHLANRTPEARRILPALVR